MGKRANMWNRIKKSFWFKWGLGGVSVNLLLLLFFVLINRPFPPGFPGEELPEPRLGFFVSPSILLASLLAIFHLDGIAVFVLIPYWLLLGILVGLLVKGLLHIYRNLPGI
jgi:hypothetical protein